MTTMINVRTDDKIKAEAEEIFATLGINMSSAINIFLHKAIMVKGMPFDLKIETPTDTTLKAMEESDKLAKTKSKSYKDIDSLRSALDV